MQSPRACRGWLYTMQPINISVPFTFGLNLLFQPQTQIRRHMHRMRGSWARGGGGPNKMSHPWNKTRRGFSNICMRIDAAWHRQRQRGLYVIADEQCHRTGIRGGKDSLAGHVMRTIFTVEAVFEPYDCANLNLTVIPRQFTGSG